MEGEVTKSPFEKGVEQAALVPPNTGNNIEQNGAVDATILGASASGDNTVEQAPRNVSLITEGGNSQRQVMSPASKVPNDANNTAEDKPAFRGALTVHARYRHHPNSSQGSFSAVNGSGWSASHSRMSSREQLSWDFLAWKEAAADLGLSTDPAREYLRFSRISNDGYFDSQDTADQRPRRHARSLAAWDRGEVEAFGKNLEKDTIDSKNANGFVSPIGKKDDVSTEGAFETAPLGHQQSFSLFSHKDSTQLNRDAVDNTKTYLGKDEIEHRTKCPIMTHVIVTFKFLYGVYYVPQSEWGKFNVGDLVSVESHTGENTGRVVHDLTKIIQDSSLLPAHLAALKREVLYPEDASLPLETVDPVTHKETLLRLPRVIRRGMNKGKKRLYYARRRDTEAFTVCQRLIRERALDLSVTGVEYQVDFKRLTVYCSGSSSSVNPNDLLAFIQQVAAHSRGSAVEVLFSTESPESLEVTRNITNGVFNQIYQEALANTQETQGTPSTQGNTRTPPSAHHPPRAPRPILDGSTPLISTPPVMPLFNLPPPIQPIQSIPPIPPVPPRQPVMMTTMSLNTLYGVAGVPPFGWGWPTPPPYVGHPHIAPSMGGRM